MSVTPIRKSKLLAVSPELVEPKKPKILIFGPPGVGKTWGALDFPGVYYIDTEAGADLNHYRDKLKRAGGAYFGPDQGSLDFDAVISQVEALATEKHEFKTIVFDSITKLFNTAIADEQARLGDADVFGASKKPPIRQMIRLIRWVNRTDMNAVFIAHQKDLWGTENKQRAVIGQTFDGYEKMEYELHLVLRISKIGSGDNAKRFAHIGKSRLASFPEGQRFDWTYNDFAERYGRDIIETAAHQIVLATPEQIAELDRLLEIVKSDGLAAKWFKAAEVDSFEEMTTEQVEKCITYLKGKLQS